MTLSLDDWNELHWIAQQRGMRNGPSSPPYDGYTRDIRRAHRLVRLGLCRRERYSEQIQGEPRFYWWAFYVTDKGRKVLRDGMVSR